MNPNPKPVPPATGWLLLACLGLPLSPLSAQQPRLRTSLRSQAGGVYAVAFSPDGRTLATGRDGQQGAPLVAGVVQLWDMRTGGVTATLTGHPLLVYSVAFSPDGKSIASASMDGSIKLLDAGTGKLAATLQAPCKDAVASVAFSPDGKLLASGCTDRTVKLWDTKTGRSIATLGGVSTGLVYSVAFSPDGRTVAAGYNHGGVKLWEVSTAKELATLQHDSPVWSVAFSPDGRTLAAGGMVLRSGEPQTGEIRLWDVGTRKNTATLTGHLKPALSVAFSPDGTALASGSEDQTVRLWDTMSGENTATLPAPSIVGAVAFSPDGKLLAAGSNDGTVQLWDVPAVCPTAARTTAAALPQPDGARQLFEAMEQKLAQASGYRVDFKSEVLTSMGQGKSGGTVLLAPGNRLKITLALFSAEHHQGQQPGTMDFVSDGKTLVIRRGADARTQIVEIVKDRHQDTVSGWGCRIGLFFTAMSRVNHGRDDDYRLLTLSDFRTVGKDKVEGREATVIEFTIARDTARTRHRLWLDAQKGLPLKLVAQNREGFGVVETYRSWEIDPRLPDATFALPKDLKPGQ